MFKYTIGFDVDSSETGINAAIQGCQDFIKENEDIKLILFGNEKEITSILNERDYNNEQIKVVNAQEKILVEDEPVKAIRTKKESSIVLASNMIKAKEIDAFVSSGSTGALVAASIFIVGRIKGIDRPALGGAIPKKNSDRPVFLMDLGASVDVKEKNMVQFAQMGKVYLENVLGYENPKIGLINIGVEDKKGNEFYKSTFQTLANEDINFIGNVEARDIFQSNADILVMDGFTGNMVLKTIEATVDLFGSSLKTIFMKSLKTKISALLVKKDLSEFKNKYDYKELGGTPLFGVEGLILKAHGSSDARAYNNALKAAKENLDAKLIEKLRDLV